MVKMAEVRGAQWEPYDNRDVIFKYIKKNFINFKNSLRGFN